jgi:hypothetical protein
MDQEGIGYRKTLTPKQAKPKIEKYCVRLFQLLLSKQTAELQSCLNSFSGAVCQLIDYLVSDMGGITLT